ncbi:IS200/IS605 family accessory protein TnpB-related protein [Candidatus Bathyarchaeota archaeon]|nr:IS200/IS605 family accessory protein TnpB-related protein [Candidatus Bathyarchaeota archaeon]
MHELTTRIARKLREKNCGAIFENLKGIKRRILNGSKDMNRKLSKWNARAFQSMLEYKLKWFGLDVKYVNPRRSSKTCPLCSEAWLPIRVGLRSAENAVLQSIKTL